MTSADLAERIQAKRRGDWYDALCPAHDDHHPSLSFKDGDRGIVFKCRKCRGRDVATAMAAHLGVIVREFFWKPRPNLVGAGGWKSQYTRQLLEAGVEEVVVVPDNDADGEQHAQVVAASCLKAGLLVKIVHLPGLPPKGDVSDWLADGHTREELFELV